MSATRVAMAMLDGVSSDSQLVLLLLVLLLLLLLLPALVLAAAAGLAAGLVLMKSDGMVGLAAGDAAAAAGLLSGAESGIDSVPGFSSAAAAWPLPLPAIKPTPVGVRCIARGGRWRPGPP
jgi:hypothetical protein